MVEHVWRLHMMSIIKENAPDKVASLTGHLVHDGVVDEPVIFTSRNHSLQRGHYLAIAAVRLHAVIVAAQ